MIGRVTGEIEIFIATLGKTKPPTQVGEAMEVARAFQISARGEVALTGAADIPATLSQLGAKMSVPTKAAALTAQTSSVGQKVEGTSQALEQGAGEAPSSTKARGHEIFPEITEEMKLEPPKPPSNKPIDVTKAVEDVQAVGLMKGTEPGSVGAAFQEHAHASEVRQALGTTGKVFESARSRTHLGPEERPWL